MRRLGVGSGIPGSGNSRCKGQSRGDLELIRCQLKGLPIQPTFTEPGPGLVAGSGTRGRKLAPTTLEGLRGGKIR